MYSTPSSSKSRLPLLLPPNWLRLLIVVLLLLSVFFRFVNLDRKVYWKDEAFTSLRVSGYTKTELVEQIFQGKKIGIKQLQTYQHLNSEKSVIDTVKGLAVEEPQLPPLYFVILRFWVQWFGDSVAVIRSLSVLISLIVFPCLYWLCLELFQSSLTGWVAIALIAVSPFHLLYAQEARPYSLWILTILLSSAALLYAMRRKTIFSWTIYAVSLALGLYSFLFTGLVAISHGIYVIAVENFKFSKTVIAYLLAGIAGIIIFVPWLLVITANFTTLDRTTGWASANYSKLFLIKEWVDNTRLLFFDLNQGLTSPGWGAIQIIAIFLIILLSVYSIYFLCRQTPKRVWLFILTLIGVTGLALALPDLIKGGLRSASARYSIPCYLGLQLAVSHLLATYIISPKLSQQRIYRKVLAGLIFGGVVSCVILSQAVVSWNKFDDSNIPQVAQVINQATRPLLLTDTTNDPSVGTLLSLTYWLDPKVQLILAVEPNLPKTSDGFNEVFLYNPSEVLRSKIKSQQNYQVKPVSNISDNLLWKLDKL